MRPLAPRGANGEVWHSSKCGWTVEAANFVPVAPPAPAPLCTDRNILAKAVRAISTPLKIKFINNRFLPLGPAYPYPGQPCVQVLSLLREDAFPLVGVHSPLTPHDLEEKTSIP